MKPITKYKDSSKKMQTIKIRQIRKSDSAKTFLDFISELIDEDVFIQVDKKPTLRWEKNWLKAMKKSIKEKEAVWLGAWVGKKLVATTQARRGLWNERNNSGLGITVLKKYRGIGLGEKMLRRIINLTKKKLKPKNIYLSVAAPNKPALTLYKKLGFKTFAKFPNLAKKEKYFDVLYMILK